MTEDQKDLSYLLEILHASRPVPRTGDWIASEMRVIRGKCDTRALLDAAEDNGLVDCKKDDLGLRRYSLTERGMQAWDAL